MVTGDSSHATLTFEGTLEAARGTDRLLTVCRQYELLRDVISTVYDTDVATDLTLRVVAPKSVLRDLKRDFGIGWLAGELIAADRLSLHEATADLPTSVFVTETRVDNPLPLDDRVASTVAEDEELASAVHTTYWEDLDTSAYVLPYPGRERVLETLAAECDDAAAEAFAAGIEANQEIGGPLTVAVVAILAGARSEALHYDLGKWADYHQIRSKASLTRAKQDLVEADLVRTTKVQIEVGRPRQRLHLDESVTDADMEPLVEQAAAALD
ncbi:DUF5821 family protein [Haloparvum alkalitolerans]|uniref:transcriptional regulator TbsP domain-containing protein n=1 Tax=Haloparvum alkalitolerans TaxID=1042953 RepID=UPI003CEDB10C